MDVTTTVISFIFVLSALLGAAFVAFYTRAQKQKALVRTGYGGEKVFINNGGFVFPVLHDLSWVRLSSYEITVECRKEDALRTSDNLLLDVEAAFSISIPPNPQNIAQSAKDFDSDGNLSSDAINRLEKSLFASVAETIKANTYMNIQKNSDNLNITCANRKLKEFGFKVDSIRTTFTAIIPEDRKNKIERSISFSSEYKQSGIAMLNYFSDVLAKKHPEMDVIITIEQHSNNVIVLVIETPEGEVDRVEHELSMYGKVLSGRMLPEDYFDNRNDVLELTNKIELAKLEIRQKNALIRNEKKHFNARIKEQKETIGFLKDILDTQMYNNNQTLKALKKISLNHQKGANKSMRKLIGTFEAEEADKEVVIQCLKDLKENEPSIIESFNELILKGSIQGVSGNLLYECMKGLHLLV